MLEIVTMKAIVSWLLLALVAYISGDELYSHDYPEYFLGDDGIVRWRRNCNFYGNDIASKPVPSEGCGSLCYSIPSCNHFTWDNGTCYLKNANIAELNKRLNYQSNIVCGFIPTRFAKDQC